MINSSMGWTRVLRIICPPLSGGPSPDSMSLITSPCFTHYFTKNRGCIQHQLHLRNDQRNQFYDKFIHSKSMGNSSLPLSHRVERSQWSHAADAWRVSQLASVMVLANDYYRTRTNFGFYTLSNEAPVRQILSAPHWDVVDSKKFQFVFVALNNN